ncbi:MAG: hypothetical protein ABI877_00450 [Gemmatimonadaceae bacterium]
MRTTAWRRMLAILAVVSLAAVPLHGVVARAAALTALADVHPWFAWSRAGLLYVLVPLAVLSASVLFLAPGLMLAVAFGRASTLCSWVVTGMALSLLSVSLVSGLATAIVGGSVLGVPYGVLVFGLALSCALFADRRVARGRRPAPALEPNDRLTLALMLALALGVYYLLAPKFLWESVNGDGVHAFESSRLLVRHAFPFWPREAGPVAAFPGMTTMLFAFPNAWYLRLFGEVDAAVRFPFLLYLVALLAALLSLGEKDGRRIPVLTQSAVTIGLVAYALAMAFSATYNPYSADIALPATQDTLLVVCCLAAMDAYWRHEWAWLGLFAALTYTSLPNGLILLGFLLVADLCVTRPVPWRQGARLAITIVACAIGAGVLSRLIAALGVPMPGGEYGLVGILRYFAFLQFTDWSRLLLVVVPAGILPFATFFRWSILDRQARALVLVTAAYFLFFFVQAHIALHHFVPAMLLPVPVALRALIGEPQTLRRWSVAWCGAAIIAVVLSLPREFVVHTDGQKVGASINLDLGDYATSSPDLFRHAMFLDQLFPYDWDPRVPFESYGGSPLVWSRYASHGALPPTANYRMQRVGAPVPAGMHRVAADSTVELYARDMMQWVADQARRPPTPAGSATYYIPRGILFHAVPNTDGPTIIDVVATLERLGIDMTPILARLGVKR